MRANEDSGERENDRNDHLMNGENGKRETYRTHGKEGGKKMETAPSLVLCEITFSLSNPL